MNTHVKNMASNRTVFPKTSNFNSGVMEDSVKWRLKYNTVTAVNCIIFCCEFKCSGNVRNDTFYFVLSKRGLWRQL